MSRDPTFDDSIRIFSTDNFSGNLWISEIVCTEHFTFGLIPVIIVSLSTIPSSIAKAVVKVLKTDPSSKTPLVKEAKTGKVEKIN